MYSLCFVYVKKIVFWLNEFRQLVFVHYVMTHRTSESQSIHSVDSAGRRQVLCLQVLHITMESV